jgi:hypothetical protein
LAAGGSCTFEMAFQPQTKGTKNDMLRVFLEGKDGSVKLAGVGTTR